MATHDYNLANQDGASFRSDLNNALAAIVSNNSSSTAPATTFAHQIWVDTTANVIKQRNAANDAWVELWRIDGGFNAKTFSSNVTLNAQSDLRFADSDSSNWVAFQAPATVASNVTWTLPSADGTSGQVIETNGSGVLSWTDAGGVTDNITEGNTSAEVVDTGSDGHFKVVTEGTEALRVDSSQRVGIATASPGRTLDVNGIIRSDGTSGALAFGGNSSTPSEGAAIHRPAANTLAFVTNSSECARLDSSGRLGIGTSSPAENLEVSGSGGTSIKITDTSTWAELSLSGAGSKNYISSDDNLEFYINGSTRASIDTSGNLQFNSGYGSATTVYGCRAWCYVSMSGSTSTLVDDGGVSSVGDLGGAGQFSINFSFTFPDNDYCMAGSAGALYGQYNFVMGKYAGTRSTTRYDVTIGAWNGGSTDPLDWGATFFR